MQSVDSPNLGLINRLKKGGKQRLGDFDDEYMMDVHWELLKKFKWIPLSDLKEMSCFMAMRLLQKIMEEKKNPDYVPVIIMGYAKKK